MNTNRVFCPSLWYGLDINTVGGISPCCFWEPTKNISESTIEEFIECSEIKKYRRKMLEGEEISPCKICYDQERRGLFSQRQTHLKLLNNLLDQDFTEDSKNSLGTVSLRFSNKCNLHCIQCGDYNSSVWEKIYKVKRDINSAEQQQEICNYVKKHSSELREVYMAGGEPVLIDACWDLLEFLLEKQLVGIELKYNTNMTTLCYRNKNIVDLWKAWLDLGGRLYIGASLDAVGTVAESIRQGCHWNVVDSNVKTVLSKLGKYGTFTFSVSPCISILNILHIPDLINHMITVWNMKPDGGIFRNILITPLIYNIRTLPEKTKNIILDRITYKLSIYSEEVKPFVEYYRSSIERVFRDEPVENGMSCLEILEWYSTRVPKFNIINPDIASWWLDK